MDGEPIQLRESVNTGDERFKAMRDALDRIDAGDGTVADVKQAVESGASFYAAEAKVIWGSEKTRVAQEAERFGRAKDGGNFGLSWFCADTAGWAYGKALDARLNNAPKSAAGFYDRALKWTFMLQQIPIDNES